MAKQFKPETLCVQAGWTKNTPFNAQPTMLWSENDLLNCLFSTYAVMQYAYHTGKITHEKYFEWKLQWSFGSTITHSSL